MTKNPKPRKLTAIWWDGIKSNPIKFGSLVLGFLAAAGTAYSQADNIVGAVEHFRWATPVEARLLSKQIIDAATTKIIIAQTAHEKEDAVRERDLNYLLLRDARQALKDAKEDLAKNPTSTEAKTAVDHYQRSIDRRQQKLESGTR